jgi:hypothetical protein
MVEANRELFDEVHITQKFNVSSSSQKSIESVAFNAKNYIKSCNLVGFNLTEDIVDHLANNF